VGFIRNASLASLLAMQVSVAPMVVGLLFAVWPSERRLALMRPLSLAGIFAGVSGLLLTIVNTLAWVSRTDEPGFHQLAAGMAEGLVSVFVSFACLTAAWLFVAIGMRKHS
jgi:hypothetical protein